MYSQLVLVLVWVVVFLVVVLFCLSKRRAGENTIKVKYLQGKMDIFKPKQ